METSYQRRFGRSIEINPMDLLNLVYAPRGEREGLVITDSVSKNSDRGGYAWGCTITLSDGFAGKDSDLYVVDGSARLEEGNFKQLKKYISTVGGVVAAVPDVNPKKIKRKDNHWTLNHVTDREEDYDHVVTIIGWDDEYPKENFADPASQDGAWFAYNSNRSVDYYIISYDTVLVEPTGVTVSDEYNKVISYDSGNEDRFVIDTNGETKIANVFDEGGILSAVGTYNVTESQDITIEIYDKDLKKVKYKQDAHLDYRGYHVIKLNKNLKMKKGFAVAITFHEGAPVEGEQFELSDNTLYDPSSEVGKSFVYLDDSWADLHDADISKRLGIDFTPNNACIKALFTEKQ
jgi:hypothetical protein